MRGRWLAVPDADACGGAVCLGVVLGLLGVCGWLVLMSLGVV